MTHEEYVDKISKDVRMVLEGMISGTFPLLQGVRFVLLQSEHIADVGTAESVGYFRAVDSDTDHSPLGEVEKSVCEEEYLNDARKECEAYLYAESGAIKRHAALILENMMADNKCELLQRGAGPQETIAKFESRLSLDSANSRSLFDYADALRLVGRCAEALDVYEVLSEKSVTEERRWLIPLFKGQVFSDMGLFSEAELLFRAAMELNSGTTVPFVYLAANLASQGRFEEAVSVLQRSLELPGDQDEVHLNLGLCFRALGRLGEASEELQKSLSINPSCDDALDALEDIRRALAYSK